MNKNHRRDVALARKNYARGVEETTCTRKITVAGSTELKDFNYTITIKPKGCVRKRHKAKVASSRGRRPQPIELDSVEADVILS
jgi:hypothetical protein